MADVDAGGGGGGAANDKASADPALDRTKRFRPGHAPDPPPPPPASPPQVLSLRLVSPTTGDGHNRLRLVTWAEVRLLSAHGKPIAGERCQLFTADRKIIERKTNADGVARFDGIPLLPPDGSDINDTTHPAFVFPDILEESVEKPPGDFGKHDGARDDYRQGDGAVHFVTALEKRTEVTLSSLPEEQKLWHFMDAYTTHAATYAHASPKRFTADSHRWEWGTGSVCNQHVNFFLSYWFNYNAEFTDSTSTIMTALPLYTSKRHTFPGNKRHRSFLEFLDPVTGFGRSEKKAYDKEKPETWPKEADLSRAWTHMEYIRVAKYFDYQTGSPTEEGMKLIDALGPINVYSVSNVVHDDEKTAEGFIRDWLKKHRKEKAGGATDKQIDGKKSSELWETVFDLDDADALDAELLRTLRNKKGGINWDHHCGILMVRETEEAPLRPETKREDRQLLTFSADGTLTSPQVIKQRKFGNPKDQSTLLYKKALHLAIWRLAPLAGGFAPEAARQNEGAISVDSPPRFIHWG